MHPIFGESPIPRNVQLAELFRHRIARGMWSPGENLPSLDELVKEFDVSRVTVRQAIDRLAREGLVSPQQGRGTIVTGRGSTDRWFNVQTTLDDLCRVYLDNKPDLQNLDEGLCSPTLTATDGQPVERYRYIRRLHSRDGVPYCVISIYLDDQIFLQAPERFREEIVILLLRELPGITIARAHQTLTNGAADVEVAQFLRIPINAPVTEVRRVFTDPQGRVFYLADVTYRGDFIRLVMDLRV